ncbi:MAG: tetratricopeptide repeat protein [Desulfovibrio sp.]|nr:tetratricopeptide repeat protein [Desulfovibrio sp.]
MENASSLGVFVVSDRKALDSMPVRNDSGLWQAWNMADDAIMVQPLDVDQTPCGNIYTLSGTDFSQFLKPLSAFSVPHEPPRPFEPSQPPLLPSQPLLPDEEMAFKVFPTLTTTGAGELPQDAEQRYQDTFFAPDADKRHSPYSLETPFVLQTQEETPPDKDRKIQADSPDLLQIWLDESQKEIEKRKLEEEQKSIQQNAQSIVMDLKASSIEKAFEIVDHSARTPKPVPDNGAGLAPQTRAEAATPGKPRGTQSWLRQPAPLRGNPEEQPGPSGGESRQQQYPEHRLRERLFALISAVQEDTVDPDLDAAIANLIAQDMPSGSKYKFMFTEFGMALRRKKKIKLALLCHMRALNFAPNDENVLFNVARTEYELGRIDKAEEKLNKALLVNPGFTAAANFLSFLKASNRAAG